MKIYQTEQIRAWDAFTIAQEPIASVDLMDRASAVFVDWFTAQFPDTQRPVYIYAGTGNNGGDGIATASLLRMRHYDVKVFVCTFSGKKSPDFEAQIERLPKHETVDLVWVKSIEDLYLPLDNAVLIDALFGSGLSRPLEAPWSQVIDFLNHQSNPVVSIDLPSGMFADRPTDGPCVRALATFSFERPKLAFFMPENADKTGDWYFNTIGLHPGFEKTTVSPFDIATEPEIRALVKKRGKFSHKGTFGHALLIVGTYGKMGAAVLSARACTRAGVGLLTLHVPGCGYPILQITVPEAMCLCDNDEEIWTDVLDTEKYQAIGVGCGIGTEPATVDALERFLQQAGKPLVIDADALNILGQFPELWRHVPKNSILTPHPKEFERLFGKSMHDFERNELQRQKSEEHGIFIVLKGAYTAISSPNGDCWFNSSGNPGMATGGSGDVLTGILTALLAQGYAPWDACRLGVYLHGRAGDLAAAHKSQQGLVAGDIVDGLAEAWLSLS